MNALRAAYAARCVRWRRARGAAIIYAYVQPPHAASEVGAALKSASLGTVKNGEWTNGELADISGPVESVERFRVDGSGIAWIRDVMATPPRSPPRLPSPLHQPGPGSSSLSALPCRPWRVVQGRRLPRCVAPTPGLRPAEALTSSLAAAWHPRVAAPGACTPRTQLKQRSHRRCRCSCWGAASPWALARRCRHSAPHTPPSLIAPAGGSI